MPLAELEENVRTEINDNPALSIDEGEGDCKSPSTEGTEEMGESAEEWPDDTF